MLCESNFNPLTTSIKALLGKLTVTPSKNSLLMELEQPTNGTYSTSDESSPRHPISLKTSHD